MNQEDTEPFGPLSPLRKKNPQLLAPTGNTDTVPPKSIQSYTPEDIVVASTVGEYLLGGGLGIEQILFSFLQIVENILRWCECIIKKLKALIKTTSK